MLAEWFNRDNLECSARALLKGDVELFRNLFKKINYLKIFYYGFQSLKGLKYSTLLVILFFAYLPGVGKFIIPIIKFAFNIRDKLR